MKTLNVMLSNLGGRVVPIGYEGENLYTRVRINCIEVFADYPDATVSMVVNPPTGNMYPAIIEKSGVMVIWDISDAVLSSNGSGECQLTFTDGDVVRKSVIFGISINRSLIASGEAPEPVQEWIERAEQTAQEIAENAANLAKEDIVESYGSIAPAIIETASGAIASFSDGADGMLVKTLTVDIDPVQDLHGYDSPWPAGGGVNKLPQTNYQTSRFSVASDGKITQTDPTSSSYAWSYANAIFKADLPAGTYTITEQVFTASTSSSHGVRVYDSDGNNVIPDDAIYGIKAIGSYSYTFTLSASTSIGVTEKMYDCVARINIAEGSTSKEWVPYSNVCPISGWTSADVTRTGKNLLRNDLVTATRNNVDFTKNEDGTVAVAGTASANTSVDILGSSANTYKGFLTGSYIISKGNNNNNVRLSINMYNGATWIKQVVAGASDNVEFEIDYDGYDGVVVSLYVPNGANVNETVMPMIRYASETDNSYAPYNGNVYTYPFPQSAGTVYGAKAKIWQDGTGTLVADMASIDLGSISWYNTSTSTSGIYRMRSLNVISNMKSCGDTDIANAICSTYETIRAVETSGSSGYSRKTGIAIDSNGYIRVYDPKYNDGGSDTPDNFKTAMSGVQFVYELATPVSYTLTAQQVVSLLKGQNNVWADTGDVALEYPADTKLYIDARVAELQALILENISNS